MGGGTICMSISVSIHAYMNMCVYLGLTRGPHFGDNVLWGGRRRRVNPPQECIDQMRSWLQDTLKRKLVDFA